MHVQVVNLNLKDMTGAEYRAVCDDFTPMISSIPGLLSEVWLADEAANTYGKVSFWKDRQQAVAGYYRMFDPEIVDRVVLLADPIARGFWEHLQHDPPPKGQHSLFVRTWLSDNGEGPSPARGALWLDIKRTYMSHRPNLRRVYATIRDATPYGNALGQLGFAPAWQVELGDTYYLAVNDMGPDCVDRWLAGLVAAELGIDEE